METLNVLINDILKGKFNVKQIQVSSFLRLILHFFVSNWVYEHHFCMIFRIWVAFMHII